VAEPQTGPIASLDARTRLLNALRGLPVDRPPVAAVVTGITMPMMTEANAFWPEAHTDVDQLVRLAETIWTQHGIESIKLPFDMAVESEILGATMEWGSQDILPTELGSAYNHPDELIISDDFLDRGRIPIVLQAITRLRRRYESEVAVVASIVGPFTLGAKLFGFDNFFTWLITDPDYVLTIMDRLTELAIKYAAAQVDAGADVILIGEASCSGMLISPDTYRDVVAERHARLCLAISVPSILHICGRTARHIPYLLQTGVTGYSFDEGANIDVVRSLLKGKVAMVGYVPTVGTMLDGTPEDVYRAATECLQKGVDVLAPGCSLPPHTTNANIAALVQAARDWVTPASA
jgi:[methyl-Co(III) methanol-specific corrinoid protein]:coenzyme M methyltransferase